jgi:hypothetical protein
MLNKFAPFPWGLGAAGLPAAVLSPPPAMTGMSPGTGVPDTPVTITGSGFGSMTGTIAVHGQAATVTSWTTTQIVFRAPAQASYPDTGTVLLTTAAGRTEGTHSFTTITLGSTAIADGATYGYRFDESSGNLIDFVGGGSNLTVATQVTRGVVGPNEADLKAYQFTGAAGAGAPSYGHCEGSRPTTNALTAVTYEAIVKANANGNNIAWLGRGLGGSREHVRARHGRGRGRQRLHSLGRRAKPEVRRAGGPDPQRATTITSGSATARG